MRYDNHRFVAPALVAAMFIAACSENDAPDDAKSLPTTLSAVLPAEQALAGAHIPTVDPATLNDAEIIKLIGERPRCTFRYTSASRPVLAASRTADGALDAGVVKLNGNLVPLQAQASAAQSGSNGFALGAPPVRVQVQWVGTAVPTNGKLVEADMVFEVDQRLKVGYSGFMSCT